MKKILIMVLLIICMTAITPVCVMADSHTSPQAIPQNTYYGDIFVHDWFFNEVMYVTTNGLMNGTSSTTFAPNATMSRAMAAVIFYRLADEPPVQFQAVFSDVRAGEWYSNAIIWAANSNIVQGVGDGRFHPTENVTREQLAVMFYRYAIFTGIDTGVSASFDLAVFRDYGQINGWAIEGMRWAVYNRIIIGVAQFELAPNGIASRAQCAMILYRFVGLDSVFSQSEQILDPDPDPMPSEVSTPTSDPNQTSGPSEVLTPISDLNQASGSSGVSRPTSDPNQISGPPGVSRPDPAPPEVPGQDLAPPEVPEQDLHPEALQFEIEVLVLVNIERESRGIRPLEWDAGLGALARNHSMDMARRGFFSHTCLDGITPRTRIQGAGISHRFVAENIAWGQRTPESVVNSWMNSPGHRSNILNENMTHLGVGFYNYFWTQKFTG